jgi:hypothetical protein
MMHVLTDRSTQPSAGFPHAWEGPQSRFASNELHRCVRIHGQVVTVTSGASLETAGHPRRSSTTTL